MRAERSIIRRRESLFDCRRAHGFRRGDVRGVAGYFQCWRGPPRSARRCMSRHALRGLSPYRQNTQKILYNPRAQQYGLHPFAPQYLVCASLGFTPELVW
jgi:hypothetical protein